ncbi:TIGR03013 family XrtA/PEP-CTERM system glycosyltransferase [Desulfopila sp. IMCC35008]|uniref:TIGR03013 family XrtA/PEP-CTERM system glycosyltransferase n=1 Tax=Desulfopila sp. IMCC35008 TaxID=2653858 RepID=UPI0013D5C732|nr:TIGR03013 family XrtA/PEP-CTERM system glycosyltransferase [Desulfopila sp. IMCC35008]
MPSIFNKYYPKRNIVFFLGEGLLIFIPILLSCWLFKGAGLFRIDLMLYVGQAALVTFVFQLCLYFFDLYDLNCDISMPDTATRIVQAFGLGCIILSALFYLVPDLLIHTKIFWSGFLITSVALLVYRSLYYRILRQRMFVQGVVLIGTGRMADDIAREVEGRQDSVYKIVAFVGEGSSVFNPHQVPIVSGLDEVKTLFPHQLIERVVVAPDDRRGSTPVRTLLEYKMKGCTIEQGVTFYERITSKILVERVNPGWMIFSDGFVLSRWRYLVKRFLDVVMALLLFVVSFPVMVISAVIIKFESPGPILYMQERVGENKTTFKVIKFRSMRQDAEKDGAVWAKKNDDRVTKFGGFIRKVRIDELPQLWNVLKGEMSFVGPRPERPVFVDDLVMEIPYYNLRHGIKPGLTGWAQVKYPYGASKEDALRKLEYDLYYIKNLSIALDLLIIFYTVKTVLFHKGGR